MSSDETGRDVGGRVLVSLAAFVVIVAGMKAAAPLLVPFLLALFIAIILAPVFNGLQRWGLPSGIALLAVVLALVLMWISFAYFNTSVGGLFSPEYVEAPWSLARVWDMAKHLWIPIVVLGTGGTAGLIRTMRANLLDELRKPYVTTARAKGLTERRLLFKYPVRVALNPFVITVGWRLPGLISGTTITSIVLGLPTAGPLLFEALLAQDMFLAGSFLMILSVLTVIGTFISDLLLAWVDPRIRFN